MAACGDGLNLKVFLEELAWVTDAVGAEGVEIFSSEASQIKQSGCDKIKGDNLRFRLRNVIFKDCVSGRHELVC